MKSLQATVLILLMVAAALAVALWRLPISPQAPAGEAANPNPDSEFGSAPLVASVRLAFTIVSHVVVLVGLLTGYSLWRVVLGSRTLRLAPGRKFYLIAAAPSLVFFFALLIKPGGEVYAMFLSLIGQSTPLVFGAVVAGFAFLVHAALSLAVAGGGAEQSPQR